MEECFLEPQQSHRNPPNLGSPGKGGVSKLALSTRHLFNLKYVLSCLGDWLAHWSSEARSKRTFRAGGALEEFGQLSANWNRSQQTANLGAVMHGWGFFQRIQLWQMKGAVIKN
eukprot:1143007-Pelagomonas_calceolata.AAC.4